MNAEYLQTIINSGLFANIRKSDYNDAFERLRIVSKEYSKGEIIMQQGEMINAFGIVHSGSVRGEKTYPNGEIHLVALFERGSIFAMEVAVSRKKTTPFDIVANERCRVLRISIRSIEKSKYGDKLRIALLEMLANDNIRMQNKIEILAERSLRNRVLVYLNILAKKSGSDVVQVKMNREQMAQFLCVNRSALSNELNKMKREGLIDFKGSRFLLLQADAKAGEKLWFFGKNLISE